MIYNLYNKDEIKERPQRKDVRLESYVIGDNKPFVLVCPGGAYKFVSDSNEGRPFAEKLNQRGYNAFVLFYSVGAGNARYPYPLYDVARAIEFIKSRGNEFGIDTAHFALMGSSAGGHLCAYFCTEYKKYEKDITLKPDVLLLTYPVITMGKLTHKVSRDNFLGLFSGNAERRKGSVENNLTADFPPTFTWHNKDDMSVNCENSVMLKEGLDKLGVPCEMRLYETGGHGVGLAEGKDADGWIECAIDFLDKYIK
ncbi:MAG: alpha/beta hydrolase [Ruminococcaceae bacterium]|nr:alpha/beta hydrolase [Oscillospiraceae bacterium]